MEILKTEDLTPGVRTLITSGLHTDKIGIVVAKGTQTILLDIGEPLLICELPEHLEPVPKDLARILNVYSDHIFYWG